MTVFVGGGTVNFALGKTSVEGIYNSGIYSSSHSCSKTQKPKSTNVKVDDDDDVFAVQLGGSLYSSPPLHPGAPPAQALKSVYKV